MKKINQSYLIILYFLFTFFKVPLPFSVDQIFSSVPQVLAQKPKSPKAGMKTKKKATQPTQPDNNSQKKEKAPLFNHPIDQITFEKEMKLLIKQLESKQAKISISVIDERTQKSIFQYQPNQALHPASNTKIITTGIALTLLGNHFHYQTELGTTSKIGKRPNHLYWLASGDPQITDETLDYFAREIKKKADHLGIQEFQDLVIDPQNITLTPPPGFEDKSSDDEAYRAPTGPIAVEYNRLTITIKAGIQNGTPTTVDIFPKNSNVIINNQSKSVLKGKETLSVKTMTHPKDERQTLVQIEGNLPIKQKTAVVQKRAADAIGNVFGALQEKLKSKGILLRGVPKIGIYPAKGTVQTLLSYQSQPLPHYLAKINQDSNNLMAEQLLLSLAKNKREVGGWQEGKDIVNQFLEDQLQMKGFVYDNGSGLFGKTKFSAQQLVDFLSFMQKQPNFDSFYQSLAKTAMAGTLKHRLKDLPHGIFTGKTGSLNGVSSLTGYMENMIFAIIVNDGKTLNLKEIENQILRLCYYLNRQPQK